MNKILILHANCANRGDEAAVHAMVDEIYALDNNISITISINGSVKYPNFPEEVKFIPRFPALGSKISMIEFMICMITKGKLFFSKQASEFIDSVNSSDLIIHAPGGPNIGDIYRKSEFLILQRLNLVRKLGIKYMFYAPSMGPFNNKSRNYLRKKVILGAERVIVRDPISQNYVQNLVNTKEIELALDSALQHEIDYIENDNKLNKYESLKLFLHNHNKCIGITITDLLWHPNYRSTEKYKNNIKIVFEKFLPEIVKMGYGVIFIPQLYGTANDFDLMKEFMKDKNNYFILDANNDNYDAYFQQFLISKLYAVVGMRYHSNIFSAKMGIPFISISYEQKMKGFMNNIGLDDFCIDIENLNFELLINKFEKLENNYDEYKTYLANLHELFRSNSYKSTLAVKEILNL